MQPFNYKRVGDIKDCISQCDKHDSVMVIAGGTTLLDLMKVNVLSPQNLLDISRLGLKHIEKRGNSVFVGALTSNSELAHHKLIKEEFPVLSQAILSGASVQLRNMATVGGNIMQKTRCYYFRDTAFACNKRKPGSGCPAIEGYNRMHAILGGSDACVAVHGSDMCVALAALEAIVHVSGPAGERSIAIKDFHLLPGKTPEQETVLQAGELITELEIPLTAFARQSYYLKVRDRASYAFSLSSVAVALEMNAGRIKTCRLALGGVATKPWRLLESEKMLEGKAASRDLLLKAAEAGLADARALKHNAFKIELSKRCIVRALIKAGALS